MTSQECIAASGNDLAARATLKNRLSITISFLVGVVLLASTMTVDARGNPGNTGKPAPDTGQILPLSLGPAAECPHTWGMALNDGDTAGLYVVGQGSSCDNPALVGAVRWSETSGMQYLGLLPGSTGSSAEGISEDGTVVGWTGGNIGEAFVLEPGSAGLARLQPLVGMVHATADNISHNGLYIVGTSSTEEEWHAVVWDRQRDDTWKIRDLAADGSSPAIADNGNAIFNTHVGKPGSVASARLVDTHGNQTTLPGFDVVALDISADGDTVVGYRLAPCRNPCGEYPVPVYWTLQSNTWVGPVDLPALDGVDSEAMAVAKRSGKRLIVGYGFTKKDAIMRAVAWIEDSSGNFSLHRLAAIDGKGKAWARATDVNSHGQVSGVSQATGLSHYAVLWQLP